MVIANKRLLRMVRRMTIRDELRAMRLRSSLVAVPVPWAAKSGKPGTSS